MKKIILFLVVFIAFSINVNATTAGGWINNIEQFTDVNLLQCSSSSCSTSVTLNTFSYPLSSTLDFNYFRSVNFNINQSYYGDMILNFHRYRDGYLYAHNLYVCSSSSSWKLTREQVDTHTGDYDKVINKRGGLAYHSVLVQTLDTRPYTPSQQNFGSCYMITDLFVSEHDNENVGTVLHGSRVNGASLSLMGETWDELGLYSGVIENKISSIVNGSGLATASSINEVKSSLNEVKSNINELNETQKETNKKLDETNQAIKDTNDTIKDSDTSGAGDTASGFFDDFQDDDYGLSDIITMPLQVINSLTSSSCVELDLNVPFVNKKMSLPCMSSIYSQYFSDAYTLYQTATTGFVAYWVIVKIYALIKGFKDPDNDKIEVMDL